MTIDLGKLSIVDLTKLKTRVEKALAKAEGARAKDARAAMEKVARDFGVSVEEVLGGQAKPVKAAAKKTKARKAKAAPKYANPADPSKTWSGKGRQPDWYKAAIASGADESTLLI